MSRKIRYIHRLSILQGRLMRTHTHSSPTSSCDCIHRRLALFYYAANELMNHVGM